MPRFSESEKKIIKERLLDEGERLFSTHGIKKVTVEELARAAGIAKGSFYSFYPGKEHLFMEIAIAAQNKMWAEVDVFLKARFSLPPRRLLKETFIWMIEQFDRFPLIQKLDKDTLDYLFRKLPREVVEAHTRDDAGELMKLRKYGIHFSCSISAATKIMQTLALSFFNLSQEDRKTRIKVMNIILDGVLKEIVRVRK